MILNIIAEASNINKYDDQNSIDYNLNRNIVARVIADLTAQYFDKVFGTKTKSTPGTNTTQVNPPSSLSNIEGLGKFAGNQIAQNTTSTALNKLLGRDLSWNDALKKSI